MPQRLRLIALLLVSCAWLAMAYAPLVRAGFTGGDLERLARAGGWHLPQLPSEPSSRAQQSGLGDPARAPLELGAREVLRVAGPEGSFLAGFSLASSHWLWGTGPAGQGELTRAAPYRIENLALLVAAAIGLWLCVRRLLLPWTGSEQAQLGGWAAGLLFAVHPACVATVASVEGRADLLALAFSAFAGALFLRARQERSFGPMLASIALAFLAAFSGELAFGLPFALALAEGLSAHRYRPKPRRLRTALNTFAVFFGITALNGVAIASVTGHSYLPEVALGIVRLQEAGALLSALTWLPEKIGLALMPANPRVLGVLGFVLAGVLLLAALQPSLFAARSAPRLWGGVLLWWVLAFAFALLFGLDRSVDAERLAGARELLPAAFVAAGGLGTAVTAMGGIRRRLLPIGVGFGFAVLANANAQPWAEASLALESLRTDVHAARELHGRDTALLIVDPPRDVRGLDPLGPGLPWLLHPVFTGLSAETEALRVRETSRAGLLMLLRQPEGAALEAEPVVVLYPRSALGWPDGRPRAAGRASVRLGGPSGPDGPSGVGPREWSQSTTSPTLDVDPRKVGALRVTLPAGVAGLEPGQVRWSERSFAHRAGAEAVPGELVGAARGVWLNAGGRRVGWFDLSSNLGWRLAPRIGRIELDDLGAPIERAELLASLPSPAGAPVPVPAGRDWRFAPPDLGAAPPAGPSDWRVALLDLASWRHVELVVRTADDGSLVAVDAERWVRDALERGPGPVVFELERRVDGWAVERAGGRRATK